MKHRTPTLRPLNALLKQALHSRALRRAALGLGAFAPALALANPTGGQVVAGNASIAVPDSDHTIVNQASQSAILNWQQFSIGSNQYVQFIQPDSSSVVLNRVIGGNPSQILGNLSANGQVFLVNPNGVFFGQGASLDVQGLIATTLDIKDSDFMAGHYVFAKGDGAPDAGVTNQGTLTANNGYIVLAGDYANNDGVIAAQAGQVVLASGNQMTLTMADNSLVSFVVNQATMAQYAGVSNTGSIEADGGVVLMTAKVANALTATAVNNSGLIAAHSMQDHNGVIVLAAQGGDIDESGTLDASATDAGVKGGTIRIRGDGHTEIASTAVITTQGDQANGGFIELSGHTLSVRGNVTTGAGGSLLIDPAVLTITNSATTASSFVNSYGGGLVPIGFIDKKLNAGSNVFLVAGSSIKGSAALTNITATGTGNLKLGIGSLTSPGFCIGSVACINSPSTATFSPASNGRIKLSGVTINIKGTFTASASYGSISLGNVTAKAINLAQASGQTVYTIKTGTLVATNGGIVANAGNYGSVSFTGDATAKNINITGEYVNTQNLTATGAGASAVKIQGYGSLDGSYHIAVNGNIIASNGGVNINELGGYGVTVSGSITAAGPVSIMTHDSGGTSGAAITLNGPVTAKSITLNATAARNADITTKSLHANGTGTGDGVSLYTSASSVSYSGGRINVSGSIGALNGGVELLAIGGLDSGGKISVTGNINAAGVVSVTGSNIGSCCGAIHLAKVTGKGIAITLNEAGPSAGNISVGSLTALGPSYITVYMNAAGGNGKLIVNGSIKASNGGGVVLTDNGGNSIDVTGNITATGIVEMTQNNTGSNSINIGGNIKGSTVTVTDDGSGSMSIHVGNVTASRKLSLTANDGNNSGSINVTTGILANTATSYVNANAGVDVELTGGHETLQIGGITAKGPAGSSCECGVGNVLVSVNPAYSHSASIHFTGAVKASHGWVDISGAQGTIQADATITAGSDVEASADQIQLANVTANGISLFGRSITVGNLTAGSSGISIEASVGSYGGPAIIQAGSMTTTGGGNIYLSQYHGAPNSSGGGSITVTGNINAAGLVHIAANDTGSNGNALLTVGNVSGTQIVIDANAASNQNAVINTGALNAKNTVARGLISVSASGKNTTITTGAITAQGVLTPFAGGHPSTENPFFRDAANVTLATTGTGNNAITVNGGITLKGAGGHFHYSDSYGDIYTASGSTGQAVLAIKNLNAGNTTVKVTGAINATGVGFAGVDISASKVTLGGAVNLTATAGKMKQSGTVAYSSPQNITYLESGTKLGAAELFIHDTSGASLGGAVTLKGPSARLIVQGDGGITTRSISLTASGEKFKHNATGIDSGGHTVNYSSTESAGTAAVLLLAGSSDSAKSVKVQGNITVTGIGKAVVGIEGNTITTQSLTVTQAAGKYSRTGKLPSGVFSSSVGGPNQLVLSSSDQSFGGMSDGGDLFGFEQGTLNGGIAGVRLQGVSSTSYCNCETPATSITVGGSITVSAVGQGDVAIAGKTVNITGGITGTATRATANGSGMHSSYSDGFNYSIKHTANGSGGRMLVDIRGSQASGQSSGSHYNSDNNYTGTVTIGGAISLTGPTASVQIKSGTIKTGNISVNGTGENISVTDVYTPSEGSAFTLKRSGVIDWTGIELSGKAGTGKVTTGNLLAEGPLFAAIHISAGTVTVGNLGVIASSGKVTLLDTRISTTPLTFTAGDAGIAISTISSAGSTPVFGAATVNGNINVEAARDAHLLTNATVSGYVLVTAGGNIDDPLSANLLRFINHDPHSTGDSSSDAPTLNLSASALALLAGGNIILNDATLKVGTGSVPGVVGDSTGIALLATQGLVSAGTPPNATFVAGGELGLGKFTLTGDYLYMEASSYNLTGPISVPTQTVVQFAPVSLPGSIGVEPGTSTSSQLNLSGTLLNLFPGTTFLIGGTGTTGDMTIGSQGKITLSGGSNFLVETAGNVTGLDNILTTGLVGNLFELVNFQVPTASEIQNTSGTSDEKKKKTTNIGDNENGGSGGNVEQDDDTSGVCRG